mgnify:CR=1 FL=1
MQSVSGEEFRRKLKETISFYEAQGLAKEQTFKQISGALHVRSRQIYQYLKGITPHYIEEKYDILESILRGTEPPPATIKDKPIESKIPSKLFSVTIPHESININLDKNGDIKIRFGISSFNKE